MTIDVAFNFFNIVVERKARREFHKWEEYENKLLA